MKFTARGFARRIGAFLLAVAVGALVASAPFILIAIVFAASSRKAELLLLLLRTAMALPFAIVLTASFLLGIPTALVLWATKRESPKLYVSIGAVSGFLLTFAISHHLGLSLLGLVSGAMTAATWSWSIGLRAVKRAD